MRLLQWCIQFLLILCCLVTGCAPTAPTVRVWHPWWRTLNSDKSIALYSQLVIEVVAKDTPLLGSQQLLGNQIRDNLEYLLSRRGFVVDGGYTVYNLTLTYSTERTDRLTSLSSMASSTAGFWYLRTGSPIGGLGVSAARAVAATSYLSGSQMLQVSRQVTSYIHTISMEIHDKDAELVWKGESTWDSPDPSMLPELIPTLQLILSDLPSDPKCKPHVLEVDSSHALNYFKLECENRWFSCPALPYRISFDRAEDLDYTSLPSSIKNPNALAAIVDLIQSAEYALPETYYSHNPLDISSWGKVKLGGQYLLGPDKKPVNVMIKLSSTSAGYWIDVCWIASDEKYAEFQGKLSNWRKVLQDYYDVFVH